MSLRCFTGDLLLWVGLQQRQAAGLSRGRPAATGQYSTRGRAVRLRTGFEPT